MRYKTWEAYAEEHPRCAAMLEEVADDGFEFLVSMRDAIRAGRNITSKMQGGIDRCLAGRRRKNGEKDMELLERGVEEPYQGQKERLRIMVRAVEIKEERDGLHWLLLHYVDQHDRAGRAKTRDAGILEELQPVLSWDQIADGEKSRARGKITIEGQYIWCRGFFGIMEVNVWERSGTLRDPTRPGERKRGVAVAAIAHRRSADDVGLKERHQTHQEERVETPKGEVVVNTDDWAGKLSF